MRPVLFIAHHFPPMGGPGTHRSLQFVRRLRSFGYEPIVVTISDDDLKNGPYALDATLLNELPSGVEIIRIATHEPRKFKISMMKLHVFRLFWFFFFHLFYESSARWPKAVVAEVEKLIRDRNVQLVYTSSGPYSTLFIGRALQKKLGIRWVADLRDPYSDAYAWQWPSKLHWLFSRRMERKLLRYPDHLIVNTPEVAKLYQKRSLRPQGNISVLTNGY